MPESGYFRGIVILPYYSDFDTAFDVYIESDMSLNPGDTVKVSCDSYIMNTEDKGMLNATSVTRTF